MVVSATRKGEFFGVLKKAIIALIHLYQLTVSQILGPCCRFYPSCSTYASESIERFGVWKGGLLAAKRLLKCQPFHSGGYDPVPEVKE